MKAADQAGYGCLGQAIGEGLIGGVIGGIVGIVGGGVVGGIIAPPEGFLPGAGAGFGLAEIANACIDVHRYHQCEKKVQAMKQKAEQDYQNCLNKVNK